MKQTYFKIKEADLLKFLDSCLDNNSKHHLELMSKERKEITIYYDGIDISKKLMTVNIK
jgi:hypothetical protein